MTHIFISYSKHNHDYARQLADHLLSLGFDVWIDDRIDFGEDWELAIFDAIDKCAAFIIVMTPDSYDSKWVRREYHYAEKRKKPEFPVLLEGEEFPRYGLNQYVDVRSGILPPDDFYNRLAKSAPRKSAPGLDVTEIPEVSKSLSSQPVIAPVPAASMRPFSTSTPSFPSPRPRTATEEEVSAALQRARAFRGQRNRDWQPFVTNFSNHKIPDMPFCLVPVGTFQMGSDDVQYDNHYDNEKPIHTQIIDQPYWIAEFPVTNAQWALAVKAGVVKQPYDFGEALKWYKESKMANAPVAGVTWFMAHDFAKWLGCRLPSEREWEYAARGVESLRYPWGNDWNEDIPVWVKKSGGKPVDVGSKPEGKSWVDARHMIGNVWEWTNSLYQPYPYTADRESERENGTDVQRVLRGGSWESRDRGYLRAACRNYSPPDSWFYDGGLRIARSID